MSSCRQFIKRNRRREITDILIFSKQSSKETQCDDSDLEADSAKV
jgi:hypothetical protein